MNQKILFILFFTLAIISCKEEVVRNSENDLEFLEKTVEKSANGENISKLLGAYNSIILNKDTDRKEKKRILDKAYELTKSQGWNKELIGFTTSYLKEFPGNDGNEEKILLLIDLMEERMQNNTVNTLKHCYLEAYPESTMVDTFKSQLDTFYTDTEDYLKVMAEKVFENVDDIGINKLNAREYVNACEAFALVLPEKAATPSYLFNASEIARTIKTFDKTLYLYDWIIEKYPKFVKAPMALFLKGFILENDLNNIDKAKEIYREFLESYPAHDLADDVQFLYDNIGKSNEEILELIEQNKKSK